jgi:membrane-bound serine protease (ClpP class)
MRRIIRGFEDSDLPVAVYVAPPGARAASAGCIIAIASHVLAMAPSTNLGAAHPVSLGQELKEDDPMTKKVVNDMVAYATGLAKRHNRNAEWVEKAIRQAASIDAETALKLNVCDLMAENAKELIEKLDGRSVEVKGKARTLKTRGASVQDFEMSLRQRFLLVLSNPNVAYILLMFGVYGILFELASPGAVFPGAVGVICLVLGFFGLEMLPISYAGLALIGLGVLLMLLEVKVTSYGLLSMGGIGSMLLGSLMLFKSEAEYLRASLSVLLPVIFTTAVFVAFVVWLVARAHIKKPVTGAQGIVGMKGKVILPLGSDNQGRVLVYGEIWSTKSDISELKPGEEVVVTGIEGLLLEVKPLQEKKEP